MACSCIIMLICYLKLLQLPIHICSIMFYITEAEPTNGSCGGNVCVWGVSDITYLSLLISLRSNTLSLYC